MFIPSQTTLIPQTRRDRRESDERLGRLAAKWSRMVTRRQEKGPARTPDRATTC
jgi:hypothetical protein